MPKSNNIFLSSKNNMSTDSWPICRSTVSWHVGRLSVDTSIESVDQQRSFLHMMPILLVFEKLCTRNHVITYTYWNLNFNLFIVYGDL